MEHAHAPRAENLVWKSKSSSRKRRNQSQGAAKGPNAISRDNRHLCSGGSGAINFIPCNCADSALSKPVRETMQYPDRTAPGAFESWRPLVHSLVLEGFLLEGVSRALHSIRRSDIPLRRRERLRSAGATIPASEGRRPPLTSRRPPHRLQSASSGHLL
jgi:hypothetical protein